MKTKRTKFFLLATAGSTVDGRTIDDKMLDEMASSYNPKTYGARLNIEHIRGISGDKPFRSYGDVAEVKVGEVDVDFNGKLEKRKAFYGAFDILDDAEQLNAAGQKVYPSIEIEPNFGGKGHAYLMGVALTDSPASIATERLQFNVTRPGALTYSRDEGALLEFDDKKDVLTPEGGGFLNALTAVLEKFTGAKKDDPAAPAVQQPAAAPGTIDMAAITTLFTDMGKAFESALQAQTNAFRGEIDQVTLKVTSLAKDIEGTPAPNQLSRPLSSGSQVNLSKVF